MDAPLPSRRLVLLGAGHTNAHVLRMWRMEGIADCQLTCISNFPVATYSGMLPAVLAGQVPRSRMEIDLVRLCSAVGAELIVDQLAGIDRRRREVLLREHPPVPYDALSIGIGSVPTVAGVKGVERWAVKIKPMQSFIDRVDARLSALRSSGRRDSDVIGGPSRPLQLVIVGAGAAGLEIAFCLPAFLQSRGVEQVEVTLVTRAARIVEDAADSARRRLQRALQRRGYKLHTNSPVVEVTEREVVCSGDVRLAADLVIWATGAAPPPELKLLDLPKTNAGFLETDATLRVTSGDPIFVVGDTGSIRGEPVPKAGVYAVRQGPVLWENLRRLLTISGPDSGSRLQPASGSPTTRTSISLRPYRPQKTFLKLINLGDGTAIGQWRRFAFEGRWVMRWKLAIDQRFMEKFSPERLRMVETTSMQCRGCGCKLESAALSTALKRQGLGPLDDAAVLGGGNGDGIQLMASVDFFSSPFTDPYLTGRVAAVHAASDLLASGAQPTGALAIVVVPQGPADAQQRYLSDLLEGARRELRGLGAKLIGGHTIEGPRAEIGFTVVGQARPGGVLLKSRLRPGDLLCLTKPLGVGVLLAAHMRAACTAHHFTQLLANMLDNHAQLAKAAVDIGVEAATDVTGFGLAGHLLEMLDASGVDAELDLSAIVPLPGAEEALQAGIESTLAPGNRAAASRVDASDSVRRLPRFALLFDPQTCGGFLMGVPEAKREQLTDACRPLGATLQWIGRVVPRGQATSQIHIVQ